MKGSLPTLDRKVHTVAIHVVAWIAYAGYIYAINYVVQPTLRYANIIFSLIPYCYTFYTVLYFFKNFGHRSLMFLVGGYLILFFILTAMAYLFIFQFLPVWGVILYTSSDLRLFVQSAVLGYVEFSVYALLYVYADKTIRKERELHRARELKSRLEHEKIQQQLENSLLKQQELKVQNEKAQYEYAFLQSQINPHFLFNTLNILFSQAMRFSVDLAENIAKLGEIMRYSIQSVEDKILAVPVQKELDHLQTLIEIHQLRFGDSYFINYHIDGEVSSQLIPPLSMITIVENAFKFGELRDPDNPLSIRVLLAPGLLSFVCRNKKRKLTTTPVSHNIGIRNINDRLQIAFHNRYKTSITDENGFYTFELIIQSV
jgi:sensor histidine kinase YesM